MAESLQFWVGTSSNMAPIARLNKINSASINLQLNNAGSVSLTLDRSETYIGIVTVPLTNCLLVYRNGSLVWSGPIWTVQETYSGEQKKINITAVGWFELLNHRVIRSLPGYLLTTSGITVTNPGFESALSGWTATRATAVRSTAIFDAGAASLLIAENQTGPFGHWIGQGTVSTSFAFANILGSTPVAARRYRLNFRLRCRKDNGFTGGSMPYMEILESGNRVGYVDLNVGASPFSYNSYWQAGSGPWSSPITYQKVDTASFQSYQVEWISSAINPEVRFTWETNPSQWINGDCSATTNWNQNGCYYFASTGTQIQALVSNNVYNIWTSAMNGILDPAKTYTVTIDYYWSGNLPAGAFLYIIDSANSTLIGGTNLQTSGGQDAINTFYSKSFSFTPTAAGPIAFLLQGGWSSVSGPGGIVIDDIYIKETSTNTDNLMNVDTITLQEWAGDGIYSLMDAGSIATALLQKTNSDNNSGIVPGTVQATQTRTRTYQQFSNIGREIKALSEIEAGYDFVVDPVTKNFNVYNRTNATNFPAAVGQAGAGAWVYSADRTAGIRFEYGTGADNLASVKKTQDSSGVVNRLNVRGKYALGQASDATSLAAYGLFEDLVSLPDVIDASTSVLPFYANAEIAFRKNPRIIYEIETKTGGNTPELFIDFNIGDRATLNVGANILANGNYLTQAIRIFGVQLSVDAEGNEKISGLQLSA